MLLFVVIHAIYLTSKHFYGESGSIHIEILLPAFILGMIMRADHSVEPGKTEVRVANSISYLFMMLVGLSMPLFLSRLCGGGLRIQLHISLRYQCYHGVRSPYLHVFMVTLISNLGKLFPWHFTVTGK